MQMSDVSTNVVFSIADDFVTQRAFELNISVYPLMSLERALIEESLGAFLALDN
jgi:hypothetical protein